MIYFVRRSYELDNDKNLHKKRLKNAVNDFLKEQMSFLNISYCTENMSYNDYGKPYIKNHSDIFFNISHCHELAVCAIEKSEVGIDAENIRPWLPRVAKRVCSERENSILEKAENKNEAFFRLWTLKESFVKAIGIGISYPMKTCEFLIDENEFTSIGCDGYSFTQIILNDKFICSLCLKTEKKQKNNFFRINKTEDNFIINL